VSARTVLDTTKANSESSAGQRVAVLVWAVVTLLALTVVSFIAVAPVVAAQGHTELASAIYKVFSFLCHQIPERSFHLAGHQFAVCSRCTGIYSGFAVAALGYPLLRSLKRTDTPSILWLALAVLPLVIDFGLTHFGIWQNNHLTRFLTGALLGGAAVFYVMPGLIELSSSIGRRLDRKSGSEPPAVAGG